MNNTKKVVHITTVHHPLDPRIYYKECQTLQNAGFQVTLIAPKADDQPSDSEVEIFSLKKQKNKLLRMVFSSMEAYKKARSLKADYYHIHDPELLPIAWLLKKKNNIVIYDIHEDYETSIMQKEYIAKPLRKVIAKGYRFMERLFSRRFELVLAEKYYKEKNPRGKCILNYPIINSRLTNIKIDEIPVQDKVIYTGNVTIERGAMIHARLPFIDETISVNIIGRCPRSLAEEMYHVAGERKEQLKIEGIDRYVPKHVIDDHYMRERWLAGIALFPPTEHYMKKELTKFFEYMSVGIPIICSNFPVWKEFIEQYACGIAVDPQDDIEIKQAIDYLRENRDVAIQMGNNGRKAVMDKLNWDIEGKKLVKWYEEINENK